MCKLKMKGNKDMERYSEGAKELNDVEVFNNCSYSCYANLADAIQILEAYEDADELGLLIKLPCKVGDTVYIIEQCKDIPEQPDGMMWDSDGGYGTATGYYCPYMDNCPYNTEDCSLEVNNKAVFEDTVTSLIVSEDGVMYLFENSIGKNSSDFGKTVFIAKAEAEEVLKQLNL
jgi:hypothetical protein